MDARTPNSTMLTDATGKEAPSHGSGSREVVPGPAGMVVPSRCAPSKARVDVRNVARADRAARTRRVDRPRCGAVAGGFGRSIDAAQLDQRREGCELVTDY